MLSLFNRENLVGAWIGVLLTVACAASLSGASINAGNSALWFAVCVVPTALMLMVRSGAPAAMQEALYTADGRG